MNIRLKCLLLALPRILPLAMFLLGTLSPHAALAQEDSCQWSRDNECDEPRYGGTGACDDGTDASDCRLLAVGRADDSCQWSRDNECDEPRYGGTGACVDGSDTSDCAIIAEANSCRWAFDNECDESRWGGGDFCPAGTDTGDCTNLAAGVNDDSCRWAHDGECDEPRFDGTGACRDGTDSTDCGVGPDTAQATPAEPTPVKPTTPVAPAPGSDSSSPWQGTWSVTGVTARADVTFALTADGDTVRGEYSFANGMIVGQVDGSRFDGFWIADSSAQRCDTAVLQRRNWGRFMLLRGENGNSFRGAWSFCADNPIEAPAGIWNGMRVQGGGELLDLSAGTEVCPSNFMDPSTDPLICQCTPDLITGTVWGTDIYSNDSSVCAAAVHAGAIGIDGGIVTVYAEPGQSSYSGSNRNGITTSDWGNWNASFSFVAGTPKASYEACADTYQHVDADRYICSCPADVIGVGRIWGTGVYSDDSHICTAAVHAGAIPPSGGIITVWSLPGQNSYVGTTQFGITSSNWGDWGRSFEITAGGL